MLCVPTAKVEMVNTAFPVVSTMAVPNPVVPSMKVTDPLGIPLPLAAAVIVAVKVTDWPNELDASEVASAIALALLFTT